MMTPMTPARTRIRARVRVACATLLAVGLTPALALAQEFQKVEGKLHDEVPAGPFVGIAYGFIWVALLGYVVYVARGVGRVRGEIEELRRKVDAAGKR
jgi:CcmD family protein